MCLFAIIQSLFFLQIAYCQELSDAETKSLINQEVSLIQNREIIHAADIDNSLKLVKSFMEIKKGRALSYVEASRNPSDFSQILGSKWEFSYKIGTANFKDIIAFGTNVAISSSAAGIKCNDQNGNEGVVLCCKIPELFGSDWGFFIQFPGTYANKYYSFLVGSERAAGVYMIEMTSSGAKSLPYALTGTRLSDQTGNISNNSGTPCRVLPKSLSINQSTIPKVGRSVTFTVTTMSDCANPTAYYYYAHCPDYGTDRYDNANGWARMSDGFTTNSSLSYTFNNPGYYVVVAWTNSSPSTPNPITMAGITVAVDSE